MEKVAILLLQHYYYCCHWLMMTEVEHLVLTHRVVCHVQDIAASKILHLFDCHIDLLGGLLFLVAWLYEVLEAPDSGKRWQRIKIIVKTKTNQKSKNEGVGVSYATFTLVYYSRQKMYNK